jgi:signal transduction histidine kinase
MLSMKLPQVLLANSRRSLLYRLLVNQLVCLITSVLFWILAYRAQKLADVAVYSFIIGNLIWLFIDGGRELLSRLLHTPEGRWPGWPSMAVNVGVGTVAGYTIGNRLGAALLGHTGFSMMPSLSSALLSLLTAAIATWFFYSRERLHQEMAAAEAARRQALESQLGLLQSQLEPHMLFNTLANLRVLIEIDPARAQTMLDHLIGFLRITLSASRQPRHPLQAEFDRLGDYLALMAVRMGPRLQFSLDLPADLADLPVPPLLLQPLVENSIKHGLEPQVAGGRIEVSARRDGALLRLEVRDSGVGLAADDPAGQLAPAASAAPTTAVTSAPFGGGFGLTQIRERLAGLYPGEAGLTLSRIEQGGACATIHLPLARLLAEPSAGATPRPSVTSAAPAPAAPPTRSPASLAARP